MRTDWLIVRRLAAELDDALRGTRIRAAGGLPDGRFALDTDVGRVVLDVFGETPLATLEAPGERLAAGQGWLRAAADGLEGLRIDRVRARPGDRLLAFDCSARSRFGVASGYRIVAELVPRYGNLVLLKGETVVSSARSFRAGGKTRRTVTAGEPYEPPPLPKDAAQTLPRLVAESIALERESGAHAVCDAAQALLAADAAPAGEIFVYRDGAGALVQMHLVRLLQFSGDAETTVSALLPLLSEAAAGAGRRAGESAADAVRAGLRGRIDRRREALLGERAQLEREREATRESERLRRDGELLYAHHAEVPPGASRFVAPSDPTLEIELDPRHDAKSNAAAIFRRYKKLTSQRTHLDRRLERLAAETRLGDELAWEIERVEGESLGELAEAVERFEGRHRTERKAAPKSRLPARRLGAREISLGPDARILAGRSPQGNADLTFRIARPNDLWFHARGVPGAHVILRIDGSRAPREEEIERAASLAAFYSKACDAEKVDVDYTARKHVRKQRGAAPGLVWYTDARTSRVVPRESFDT